MYVQTSVTTGLLLEIEDRPVPDTSDVAKHTAA
jgi:hypothetical protein